MLITIKKICILSLALLSPITVAERIEHIQSTGEIELCVHPDQMPFSLRAERPKGFQVDMAKAIAQKLDVSLNVSWIRPRRQAKKTGCDFYTGVANLGKGDSKYMHISDTYMRLEFKVVTRNGDHDIKTIDDLKTKVVGVSPGSIASHTLSDSGVNLAYRFRDEASRLQALADGLIDAAIVTNVSSGWFQKNNGNVFNVVDAEEVLSVPLNYNYSLGLRKADENTKQAFNKILLEMKTDGTLMDIFDKYGIAYN